MNNPSNILRFACQQHIANPGELTMKELQDGLQFAWIRQSEGKGTKEGPSPQLSYQLDGEKAEKRTAAIKQTINREESKRMWYLIKRTVKDPHSVTKSVMNISMVVTYYLSS